MKRKAQKNHDFFEEGRAVLRFGGGAGAAVAGGSRKEAGPRRGELYARVTKVVIYIRLSYLYN